MINYHQLGHIRQVCQRTATCRNVVMMCIHFVLTAFMLLLNFRKFSERDDTFTEIVCFWIMVTDFGIGIRLPGEPTIC